MVYNNILREMVGAVEKDLIENKNQRMLSDRKIKLIVSGLEFIIKKLGSNGKELIAKQSLEKIKNTIIARKEITITEIGIFNQEMLGLGLLK